MYSTTRILCSLILFVLLLSFGGQPALASSLSDAPAPQVAPPPDDAQSTSGPTPPLTLLPASMTVPGTGKPVVSLDVPAYTWIHGCGPTAAGMVMAYWDQEPRGFSKLYPASDNTDIQSSSIEEMIASSLQTRSHYYDYAMPIDDGYSFQPDACSRPSCTPHNNNSMADFMLTSRYSEGNAYGWSWFSDVGPAMSQYVNFINGRYLRTYEPHTINYTFNTSLWTTYVAEIDAGHPVVFLVDSDGNGGTDHFVTGTGYSWDSANRPIYRFNDTWDHDKNNWAEFQQMIAGDPWGIFGMVTFYITGDDTPLVLNEHLHLPLILSQ